MFIPVQDFTSGSDINWNVGIEEVDMQLFKKYSFDASEILFIDQTIVPILHEEYY
ncbi:restriction endonuclease [Enterococcus faecium]|nr:restriction endonuclease [Enterococcus faecium]